MPSLSMHRPGNLEDQFSVFVGFVKPWPKLDITSKFLTTNAGLHTSEPKTIRASSRSQRGIRYLFPSRPTKRNDSIESPRRIVVRILARKRFTPYQHDLAASGNPYSKGSLAAKDSSHTNSSRSSRPYSRAKGWWKKIPYYYLRERPWLQKAAALHVTTVQEQEELAKAQAQSSMPSAMLIRLI